MKLRLSIILFACALGACSNNKSMYEWGNYSGSLLRYYKDPVELEKYADSLSKAIEKAEAKGSVPPGLYAEYGYAQLEMNNEQQAILYFSKERDKWPESAYLMDKLIIRLSTSTASTHSEAPSTAQ